MTRPVFLTAIFLSAAVTAPAYAIYDTREDGELCSYACLQNKVAQLEEQMEATREGAAVAQAQLAVVNQRLFAIERVLLGERSVEFPIKERFEHFGWVVPDRAKAE